MIPTDENGQDMPGAFPEESTPQPQYVPVKIELPASKPVVTNSILVITIVVYLLQLASQTLLGGDLPAVIGMKINPYIQAGQLWRLITPVLLHGSILHIGFNMYALYSIGRGLEQYYGSLRFLLLYLIGGLAGNTASFIFSTANSLGASTALFGIVAAQGVFIYHNRKLFGQNASRLLSQIGMVILVNLMLGLSPGIDNWGHLGGLLGGLAFAWFAGPTFQLDQQTYPPRLLNVTPGQRAWITAMLEGIIIAGIVALTIFSR
jgi:rhomboid protease GluP